MKQPHEVSSSKNKGAKKSSNFLFIGVLIFALAITGAVFLKKHNDADKALVQNNIVASKNSKIGKPFPDDFEKIVNIDLLREDANNGNKKSEEILALYDTRRLANELLDFGAKIPETLPDALDIELLGKDAEAGNANSAAQLELYQQRKLAIDNVVLGKEVSEKVRAKLDLELLKKDSDAGSTQITALISLIENRQKAQRLCALGKPFSYDFYEHIDAELLKQDADAGYLKIRDTLKLADNRIKAEELTIPLKGYKEDFFDQVDKGLLIADADAGNADMQYIWARVCAKFISPPDYATAFKYNKMAASQNDPRAQCSLGYSYTSGEGVERDYVRAVELYRLSAEQGYSFGLNNYANALFEGRGINRDIKAGQMWLEKAIKADNPVAFANKGRFICHGAHGYKKDLKKGIELLNKSIDMGFVEAIPDYAYFVQKFYRGKERINLQLKAFKKGAEAKDPYCMAWYGRTLVKSGKHKEGVEWIRKGVDLGHIDAISAMADLVRNGGGGLKRDIPEALRLHKILAEKGQLHSMRVLGDIYVKGLYNMKKDYNQAAKYLLMFIEKGGVHGGAYLDAGNLYRYGRGVERNLDKAIQLYEKSANTRYHIGALALGMIYQFEDEIYDAEKMIHYYKMGADMGSNDCMNRLGLIYKNGDHVPKDDQKAISYFKKAMIKGNKFAPYNLGHLYEKAIHLDNHAEEMLRYYTKGADAGHIGCQFKLGVFYLKGKFVERDYDKALKYTKLAADKNHVAACHNLGIIYGLDDNPNKDLKKSQQYFKKAAATGFKPSIESLKKLEEELKNTE